MSPEQQDITVLSKCVILYFKTVGAVSTEGVIRDIFRGKMETVLFLLPRGIH